MLEKILSYLDLRRELESTDKIHEEIERDIIFKGTNIWILVFAIVIASVGLNINSPAVIIGAMLISPLMGPINGIGYSLATYNFVLLRRSLKNFGFAVIASLVASMLYFALTPVASAHSELLARTAPTIYDVIIALFGGLAGIVAISSKRKGNVIPGVAIATALMPPLCTAGYGLGTGQMSFFFGAIYLFTINTVFIAMSAIAVSRFFKFPITTLLDEIKRKSITRWISIIIVITVLPSLYFGYKLVLNERFNESANLYVKNVTLFEGNYLLKSEIVPSERTIELIYAGNQMTEDAKQRIVEKAEDFELEEPIIVIKQGLSLNEQSVALNEETMKKTENLNSSLNATMLSLAEKEKYIQRLERKGEIGKEILSEAKALYPFIQACSYSETNLYTAENDSIQGGEKIKLITFSVPQNTLKKSEFERLEKWMKSKFTPSKIKVIVDEN